MLPLYRNRGACGMPGADTMHPFLPLLPSCSQARSASATARQRWIPASFVRRAPMPLPRQQPPTQRLVCRPWPTAACPPAASSRCRCAGCRRAAAAWREPPGCRRCHCCRWTALPPPPGSGALPGCRHACAILIFAILTFTAAEPLAAARVLRLAVPVHRHPCISPRPS